MQRFHSTRHYSTELDYLPLHSSKSKANLCNYKQNLNINSDGEEFKQQKYIFVSLCVKESVANFCHYNAKKTYLFIRTVRRQQLNKLCKHNVLHIYKHTDSIALLVWLAVYCAYSIFALLLHTFRVPFLLLPLLSNYIHKKFGFPIFFSLLFFYLFIVLVLCFLR